MPQNNKIKIRRGNNSAIPAANTEVGELRYSTDTKELYIDDGVSNVKIGGNPADFPVSTAQDAADNLRVLKSGDTMTGNLFLLNGGTPELRVYDADGVNNVKFFFNGGGSGFGTIQSTTGFVLTSNTSYTAMLGSNSPQAKMQYLGGSYNSVDIGHNDTDGTISTTSGMLSLAPAGNILISAKNIQTDTTTGIKIGTSTTQKLGFFNATPIVRVGATIDLGVALSNLGLRAAGTAYPITTSGAVTLTGTTNLNNGATIPLTKKLSITTGTNASAGTGTLTAGTATISTTVVTANSLIFLTAIANGANLGILSVGTKTAGTSFVVNSSNVLDATMFNWFIIN